MTTITINTPPAVAAPRGAIWAAAAAAQVLRFLSARQAREFTVAASPAPSADERRQQRAREATGVRRMADQWRAVDPRFAADLYAAADRHEA